MRDRDITLNGQDFHLREWGDPARPRLLFLHGFPEYGGAWADLAGRLGDGFHCVAPDQRGYGRSYAPGDVESYKVSHLVGDMVALIEEIGGPVTVVGHDWGAAVAYGLAIGRPDLVSRLIILNGVHPGPFQAALATGGAQAEASQYMRSLRREGSEDRLAADGYARLLGLFAEGMDMSWMTPDRQADYIAEWSRPGRLTGMVNWYRATPIVVPEPGRSLDLPPLSTDRFRVAMPHLLIWGLGDRALLPEATAGLEAYCDDLTRVDVPEADHWIVHQAPDRVAAIIRDWLER
ncbi:hydrolase, alpha/beta fold family protein [Pseudooceanicola batsensis HTCC2597]|uniref:Hydrolase, alpha/beta fold family protein n=1 Tax=Pseudooceanicola batsensis (strain ATCC BAA-863 / DSM 15984 / KCTC 12145 / HTCC2597) TaxID=252305 RepID=A3TYW4_PSEBH|nr:alpha/beta fold hydrolase [Pseudooceanicola batsensis]EAQ02782.1 hydrolase, alpha/beta fold family protein [Pseudooceanicola batsensis HTCC2597]